MDLTGDAATLANVANFAFWTMIVNRGAFGSFAAVLDYIQTSSNDKYPFPLEDSVAGTLHADDMTNLDSDKLSRCIEATINTQEITPVMDTKDNTQLVMTWPYRHV